jgi:hypothetical protein
MEAQPTPSMAFGLTRALPELSFRVHEMVISLNEIVSSSLSLFFIIVDLR